MSLGICGHLAVNVCFTLLLLSISGTNYPGGAAVSHLNRLARNETNVSVHIDNLAAQTGVSRFTQIHNNWIYCKQEHLLPGSPQMFEYTHLIAEAKSKYSSNLKPYISTHDVIDTIEAFHQISFNYLTIPPIKIKTKPVLFILRRRENYKDFLDSVQDAFALQSFAQEESEEEYDDEERSPSTLPKSQPSQAKKVMYNTQSVVLKDIEEHEDVSEKSIENDNVIVKPYLPKIKSREALKSSEKALQIEVKIPSSDQRNQAGNVKKSIRKLISKYRRIKVKEPDVSPETKPDMSSQERISVKKLIQQEKANVEKEELQKIQLQVLELIENNPNIINKQLIKDKIQTSVMEELTAAIEATNIDKPIIPQTAKDIKKSKEEKKPIEKPTVKKEPAAKSSLPVIKKKNVETTEYHSETNKDRSKNAKIKQLEDTEKNIEPGTKERQIVPELDDNAVDLYEPAPEEIESSDEEVITSETPEEVAEDETPESPEIDDVAELDLDQKLQYANEQIESIMTIIAEIVDTIEVTDEEDEQEFIENR